MQESIDLVSIPNERSHLVEEGKPQSNIMKPTRVSLPARSKRRGSNGHSHSPLAQNDPDEFHDNEVFDRKRPMKFDRKRPVKLDYYNSDDEDDRKMPASQLCLDNHCDPLSSGDANSTGYGSQDSSRFYEDGAENGTMDLNLGERFEYSGKRKKNWTKEEFIGQLRENEENSPTNYLCSAGSKYSLLGMFFVLFTGIAIYVNTSLNGFEFHGLASADDDDDVDDNDYKFPIEGESNPTKREPTNHTNTENDMDADASTGCDTKNAKDKKSKHYYHYDPDAAQKLHDAFHVSDSDWYGGVFSDPPHPSLPSHLLHDHDNDALHDNIGYMQYPNIHNNTMVFCSEGDVYLTTLPIHAKDSKNALPAMRLTSTVGNANTPTINPKYPYLLAFTATYTGHREVYLMDLRSDYRSRPSMRLTYMDSAYGVLGVVGWEDDGTSLIITSYNMEVAMPDQRLYKIGVVQKETKDKPDNSRRRNMSNQHTRLSDSALSPLTVSSVKAIPLSQAIDATVDAESGCRYFTRFKQSSNTVRYVGGTAESLWAFCDDQELAVPLTEDYSGTSKSPKLYTRASGQKYLFFLSDRADVDGKEWASTSMNLWVAPLPKLHRMYKKDDMSNMARPFAITSISCIKGMHLREFAVDSITGDIVLRIGADLHFLSANEIEDAIVGHAEKSLKLTPSLLPVAVYSDFNNLHERVIPLSNPTDVSTVDAFDAGYGTISALMAARGQLFVNPVVPDIGDPTTFNGGGMNIPARRYRVAPGSTTGGAIRIFGAWYVGREDVAEKSALILATDPLSATAEIAFYLVDVAASSKTDFSDVHDLPEPLIGGHINGGNADSGGLGSIKKESVSVSPCGRRVSWTDTDGHIRVMKLSSLDEGWKPKFHDLPQSNESGEPMIGTEAEITFSPSGRYIAIEHNARNQFRVISIADLGDPANDEDISITRVAQVTPDRFNSINPFWGRAPVDFKVDVLQQRKDDPSIATTLYFLSDRDVVLTGNTSPWGTRAPSPYFKKQTALYALPLVSKNDEIIVDPAEEIYRGSHVGGAAVELMSAHIDSWTEKITGSQEHSESEGSEQGGVDDDSLMDSSNTTASDVSITPDIDISFGDPEDNLSLARRAFLVSEIPASNYILIHQLKDDSSIILVEKTSVGQLRIDVFSIGDFPENHLSGQAIAVTGATLEDFGKSTNRKFIYFTYSGVTKVIPNDATNFVNLFTNDLTTFEKNIVDTKRWAVNVWPKLEYQQMYADAWRMLRDFYYTKDMGKVDWPAVHARYLPLVDRCGRREELDDVLRQMAAELSALHVFVYGGEYNDPLHGNAALRELNEVASLGAVLERSAEWNGYIIREIPERDPDFNYLDGKMIYSPLSDLTLRHSGQRGLMAGDVILGVNGESVMNVPSIHMLLRGMQGRSIRLDVLRIQSKSSFSFSQNRNMEEDKGKDGFVAEPMIVVPISADAAANLRYAAWEWKTRERAKDLAKENGFSIGYTHLRSMSGAKAEDAYVRNFFPDYDKQGFIIDVRHNTGGNIDSWLLDSLQRKAWSYWQARATNITTGGEGWDEQFAFRGHIVVLIDEKTSSDGEGFSRGVSELGLGKLVGKRTWGGGIWLASDNELVDGGIATAPEIGTYNNKFGWGLGIEQMGVKPDIEVDNNPRTTFSGKDEQLEKAIQVLKKWIAEDPIVLPDRPGPHKDMSLRKEYEACDAI